MKTQPEPFVPYLIAVNLTRRCNLACPHCYLDAQQRQGRPVGEVAPAELSRVFDEIGRRAPGTIVVLTGGEPLMHPEVESLAERGVAAGLRMVLGTNGVLLKGKRIRRFKALGLSGVGISLDSVFAAEHDGFRGVPGSFRKSCDSIRLCAEEGLHVQAHFTVTRWNHRQLERFVTLGKELGASVINFFFLVCVGRGRAALDLPADLYESVLRSIANLQQRHPGILIQSRCTPHFKRVLFQNNPASPYTRATGYDGGGCPAATHYCRIDPQGELTPCPYLELSAGNIRRESFWKIWDEAPLFQWLRNPSRLEGRCGRCEFRGLCGGCRARSWLHSGKLMGEDPSCDYVPQGGIAIPVAQVAPPARVVWTPEARARLNRVPVFLRPVIQRKLEEKAMRERSSVTPEFMRRHKRERQRALGIKLS